MNKTVMIKYSDISQYRANASVCNQIGTPVYIEELKKGETQTRAFSHFLGKGL